VPTSPLEVLSLAIFWTVTALLLYWSRLPAPSRRAVAVAASAAGIAFLLVAMNTEGLRESPATAGFLVGAPLVTGRVSASASLPYYVLTAVCLMLGTAGLAVGDRTAQALRRHWLASAVGLSLLVTLVRFLLENAAAPLAWTRPVGLAWLAPIVGAFFGLSARGEGGSTWPAVRSLAAYSVLGRLPVVVLMLVATWLRLGSHYDISALSIVRNPITGQTHEFVPGSLNQLVSLVAWPQLVFWPAYTLVVGLMGVGLALLAARLFARRTA
jgi:hypothetical protein